MIDTDTPFDVKVGQFGVVKMADGDLQAFRIVEIFEANVENHFLGHLHVWPYQCVHLEKCAVVDTRSLVRIIDTEVEAKLFMAEGAVEKISKALQKEKEAHAATRERLQALRRALRALT